MVTVAPVVHLTPSVRCAILCANRLIRSRETESVHKTRPRYHAPNVEYRREAIVVSQQKDWGDAKNILAKELPPEALLDAPTFSWSLARLLRGGLGQPDSSPLLVATTAGKCLLGVTVSLRARLVQP